MPIVEGLILLIKLQFTLQGKCIPFMPLPKYFSPLPPQKPSETSSKWHSILLILPLVILGIEGEQRLAYLNVKWNRIKPSGTITQGWPMFTSWCLPPSVSVSAVQLYHPDPDWMKQMQYGLEGSGCFSECTGMSNISKCYCPSLPSFDKITFTQRNW